MSRLESSVRPEFPPGWRIAFCWGRNAGLVMSREVWTGSPMPSHPRKVISSLVPIAAVSTGSVASTHSRYGTSSS
ncbi:hypothetical protein ACTHRK_02420 [Dietzia cercidiphylli]|uniref:hypothetical protein n=1 Tax=Dietzia cercidiphylli TaxID=498199 RepID=UPI00183D412D